jgi:hypothetical protein
MTRQFLGKQSSLIRRSRTYLADGAIEVQEIEGYSGRRRRVLFDEVTLVTLDRRRRAVRMVLCAVVASVLIASGGFGERDLSRISERSAPLFFLTMIPAAFFLLIFALEAIFGVDTVTVFGKRSYARMSFVFGKGRARRAYEMVVEEVRKAQAK